MRCAYCGDEFEPRKYQKTRKYCSRSCVIAHRNKVCTIKDSWLRKYGDAWKERYDEWRKTMSSVTSGENNGMFGRHDHVHGLKRFAREKTGKTLEETHGDELARKIRARRSETMSGSKNPAYGKVYVNGGKSVKGYYKSLFFRSLLEYSFMKHLEASGIDLHADVDYECFQAKFVFEGRERTYRPDFYVKSQRIVYEVKPSYLMKRVADLQLTKWQAMRELLDKQNIEFRVVTENDFSKVTFEVAKLDPDVIWIEKTLSYFRRV